MIPPIRVRVNVVLEILGRNDVVGSVHAALGVAPERLNSVRVGRTIHVDLGGVVDPLMLVASLGQRVVAGHLVAEDSAGWKHVSVNEREQSLGLDIGNHFGNNLAFALHNASNDGLSTGAASALVGTFAFVAVLVMATHVSLVHFNVTREQVDFFIHQMTDQSEHSPSRLVGDSNLALELFGRDASPGVSHDEYGVEPILQRSAGLVHDGVGGRGYLVSTVIALVSLAATYQMELARMLAFGAVDVLWPTLMAKPIQTRLVIRKHLVELLDSELLHHAYSLTESTVSLARIIHDVKG